jgi:hypothetical protein
VPTEHREFIAINAAWNDGPEVVNRLVADYTARSG